MKKIVIIIVVILLLAAAGGGAYYYFFMMENDPVVVEEETETIVEKIAAKKPAKPAIKPNLDYFVISLRLNVRSYPEKGSEIRSVLRKGDSIKALEIKKPWVRISDFEVHNSGRDVADWVHMDFLSHDMPEISEKEQRKTMLALIKRSDDLLAYEDRFVIATQELVNSGKCTFEDFELVGGWVRSVTFNIEPVYFVYCGGTSRGDKVYLNVDTGETFQP